MRVIVTGGAGYIGSAMVRMLGGSGHDVLVIDNLSRGHREALGGAELVQADLEDIDAVLSACLAFKPEACMHFAAHSLVSESVEQPFKYFTTNLAGGLNLLKGLDDAGCRLMVFSSTAAVYGVPEVVPIVEDSEAAPINPYGVTKLMFERVLEEISKAGGIRYASLRYFNAAGADIEGDLGEDHEPETHLIPRVIRAALGREDVATIYGTDYPTPDGTCVRDYIHVIDLCRAHLLALDRLSSGGSSAVYNLGNGNGFSVREVVEAVGRISGKDFAVVEAERRPGDPPELVASSEKIKAELGWRPGFSELDRIIDTAWQWHSSHPDGY